MAPGNYSDDFHGRIEFVPEFGIFIIYHPAIDGAAFPGRVRFSIGHELGHYFCEEHRETIIENRVHTSVSAFKTKGHQFEKEADKFASALLIPEKFVDSIRGRKNFITLKDILKISEACDASVQAAAFRYVRLASERCVAIVSLRNEIQYSFSSDDAKESGFEFLANKWVPDKSAAARCLKADPRQIVEGYAHTSEWFSERAYGARLWEESVRLGVGNFALTILSWPESDD